MAVLPFIAGTSDQVTLDLSDQILVTEVAELNASLATTLTLGADDVLDFTDADNELYITGSKGDKVYITSSQDGDGTYGVVAKGTYTDQDSGTTFNVFDVMNGSTRVGVVYVDKDIVVTEV